MQVHLVQSHPPFVDIHCHLLPSIDDGAASWDESLTMARMAAADGTATIIATPHQLGSYAHNGAAAIREKVIQLNALLEQQQIPLTVMPGADVRIEADLAEALRKDEILTLADRKKHVLLELPHETYFPLEPLLDSLSGIGMEGILSHPERNQGLLQQPELIGRLVDGGCLMQITAGSLSGTFGPACQHLAEQMVARRQAHFVASDAHGARSRRPLLRRALERVAEIADLETALALCCHHPALVAQGQAVDIPPQLRPGRSWVGWLGWKKAG